MLDVLSSQQSFGLNMWMFVFCVRTHSPWALWGRRWCWSDCRRQNDQTPPNSNTAQSSLLVMSLREETLCLTWFVSCISAEYRLTWLIPASSSTWFLSHTRSLLTDRFTSSRDGGKCRNCVHHQPTVDNSKWLNRPWMEMQIDPYYTSQHLWIKTFYQSCPKT